MNLMNLFVILLISTGGFLAATYEVIARRYRLPVGLYFRVNGIMTLIGGFIFIGAMVLSAFTNPWWTIFIVLILSLILSQVFISIFRSFAQVLSPILIIIGAITLLIIKL